MTTRDLGFRLLGIGALAALLVWLGGILIGALVPALRAPIGCSSGYVLAWLLVCAMLVGSINPVKL